MKKNKISGSERFDQHFRDIYRERWPSLLESLQNERSKIIRHNQFANISIKSTKDFVGHPYSQKENIDDAQSLDRDGLRQFYPIDLASLIVAVHLELEPGMKVLDMCAAPGGKSLILAEKLKGKGELHLNEISRPRRERLFRVAKEYIPEETRKDFIFIHGKDGLRFGLEMKDQFDAILLDAPCSGESHILADQRELDLWGPKRTKKLSAKQYGLLCSALLSCRSGGQIVYSTCSISPQENDEVIKKLLKKKGELVEVDLPDSPPIEGARITEYGVELYPDQTGHGPLYFSRLRVK